MNVLKYFSSLDLQTFYTSGHFTELLLEMKVCESVGAPKTTEKQRFHVAKDLVLKESSGFFFLKLGSVKF